MTDALAMAQLELLYRLGVLEREQPTSTFSVSNTRRPQSARVGGAGVRAELRGDDSDGEELRSVSPVHPHHHAKQLDGDDASYRYYSQSNARVKPLATSSRARVYGSVSTSPRSVSYREQRTAATPASALQHLRQPPHSHNRAKKHRQKTRNTEAPRVWFLYWKLFVRNAREENNVRAIWVFHVKKRTFAAWAGVVQHQKRLAELNTTLLQWKAKRAARKWRTWATNHQQIQLLLDNSRFSLVSRLRRRRVWLRWLRFATQRRKWNAILKIRLKVRNQRLVQTAWHELKVFSCRSRQNRRGLRKFLYALRAYRDRGVSKRNAVLQNQILLKRNAKRWLLSRWSKFVMQQRSTRRIQRQIAFRISRRRYFRIWWECMRDSQCIAQFKNKSMEVSVQQHFVAWSFAVKALRMAEKKSVKTHRATRERFFQAWKQEAQFGVHCQSAAQEFERWKLSKALTRLLSWVDEVRRQRRIEDRWRKRALEKVWRFGFLKFHQLQQDVKAEMKSLELQVQRGHFANWVRFWRARIQRHVLVRQADELSLRNRFQHSFARWKQHWRQGEINKKQIADGARHHHNRLMQCGVYKLSLLVSQRSENAEKSVQSRRHARSLIKTRCFRDWKRWKRRKLEQRSRLARFHERKRYLQSWFNPCRRVWSSWLECTRSVAKAKQADAVYQVTLKRKYISGWRRRAQLGKATSNFQRLMTEKLLEKSFSSWRSRTSHWQKMREVFALARAVFRRKRCGKIVQDWSQWTRKTVRVRLKQQQLEETTRLKTLESCFQYWHAQFHQRNKAFQHAAYRQTSWKARCLREWHRYIVKRVMLKRKLAYFQQVFGKHSTTSLVRRDWARWTRYTRIRRGVKSLRKRQRYLIVRKMWKQWKFFHFYSLVFREWRRVAAQNALESGQFGQRLRLFYDTRRHLRKTRMFSEWKSVYSRKKSEREALLSIKHRTLQAIVSRSVQHTHARAKYMKKWFSRWHEGVHARCNAARHYYEAKLARRVLIVWWRLMVNAKQELVLSEAKHALGSLSFYHPQQQLCTQIVKEKALQLRAARVTNREARRPREAKMKTMRRMLDPEEKRKYSRVSHSERSIPKYESEKHSGRQAIGESSRHVRFQTSDQDVTRSTKSMSFNVPNNESRFLKATTQNPQHFATTPHRSRVGLKSQDDPPMQSRTSLLPNESAFDGGIALQGSSPHQANPIRFREHLSESEPNASRNICEQQQEPQHTHRRVRGRNKHTVADELPLFDPPTPPHHQKARNTSSNQTERGIEAQHQHRQADQSMMLSTATTKSATPMNQVLPIFDEELDPNRQSSESTKCVKHSTERRDDEQKPPALRHRDPHADASPGGIALDTRSRSPSPSPVPLRYERPEFEGFTVGKTDSFSEISLEQLASMEVFATRSPPLERKSRLLDSVHHMPQPNFAVSSLPVEYQRRCKLAEKAIVHPPRKLSEALSLSAILELPEKHTQLTQEETKPGAFQADAGTVQELNPSKILGEILDHYALCLVDFPAERGKELGSKGDFKTGRRKQICFRMLRDLGLFHNQFYFPQMESVMEPINIEHIAVARDQVKAPLDDADKEYLRHLEIEFLKRFLSSVITEHPLYKATLKANCRARQFASLVDDERLQWLVQIHLTLWIPVKMSKQSRGRPFWIHSSLPSEVESALEKLLLCVSKYFKVLAQLFLLRVGDSNRKQNQQRDGSQQMTRTEFTQLLKGVHVFPQLLNKRELESAFDASCCSVPDQKEINFPEFVEALIRCSSSLQWGESNSKSTDDTNNSTETGVIVKFLMLLFAMEGRGSVLQKRNADLQVVIGYLEQQQVQQKAGKMHRFRKLLVDQKHQRAREHRGHHLKQTGRSMTWTRSQLRSNESRNPASPRRGSGGEEDNLFYCGEPGVLPYPSSNMLYDHTSMNYSIDLVLGGNSHLVDALLPATDDIGDAYELNYPNDLASPPDTGDERKRFLHSPESEYLRGERSNAEHQSSQANSTDTGENALHTEDSSRKHANASTPREIDLMQASSAMSPIDDHGSVAIHNVLKDSLPATAAEAPSNATNLFKVGELQDKNDFLNEILSSIGDVELVLQQSNLQLHHRVDPEISQWKARSVEEYSDDFESESAEHLTSDNVMRALFAATSSSTIFQMGVGTSGDEQLLMDQVEHVHVSDPMLDQLTSIERFTDSSEWQAHPTLEDIAELGLHAAAPSSIYQITPVQDSELNNMTDSTFGAHCDEFLEVEDTATNLDAG